VVSRPVDADLVALGSGMYEKWQGGPMQLADAMSPLQVEKKLHQYVKIDPSLWAPSPLWRQLILNGQNLEALNTAKK